MAGGQQLLLVAPNFSRLVMVAQAKSGSARQPQNVMGALGAEQGGVCMKVRGERNGASWVPAHFAHKDSGYK